MLSSNYNPNEKDIFSLAGVGKTAELQQELLDSPHRRHEKNALGCTVLHESCFHGKIDTVIMLLDSGALINKRSNVGNTSLHLGCVKGHTNVVRLLLVRGAQINLRNYDGCTPFYIACRLGRFAIAKLLIQHGCDVSVKDNAGRTAFEIYGTRATPPLAPDVKTRTVRDLQYAHNALAPIPSASTSSPNMQLGANVNVNIGMVSGMEDVKPISYNLDTSMTNSTVANRGNVGGGSGGSGGGGIVGNSGGGDFYYFGDSTFNEGVAALLDDDDDVSAASPRLTSHAMSHLHSNSISGNFLLIPSQLHPAAPVAPAVPVNIWGLARDGSTAELRTELTRNPSRTFETDWNGWNLFHWACWFGSIDIALLLLQLGASLLSEKNNDGSTALHLSSWNGHIDLSRLLLGRGADCNEVNNEGSTSFYMACGKGDFELASLMIECGADINITNRDMQTPFGVYGQLTDPPLDHDSSAQAVQDLYHIYVNRNTDMGKSGQYHRGTGSNKTGGSKKKKSYSSGRGSGASSRQGSRESQRDTSDVIPPEDVLYYFTLAAEGKSEKLGLELTRNTNRLRMTDATGRTLLHCAVINDKEEVVYMLLQHGASVGLVDTIGTTPLRYACQKGFEEIIVLLAKSGADIDEKNNLGWTPFYEACLFGRFEVAMLLIEHNANTSIRCDAGLTPFEIYGQRVAPRLLTELKDEAIKHLKAAVETRTSFGTVDTQATRAAYRSETSGFLSFMPDLKDSSLGGSFGKETAAMGKSASSPIVGSDYGDISASSSAMQQGKGMMTMTRSSSYGDVGGNNSHSMKFANNYRSDSRKREEEEINSASDSKETIMIIELARTGRIDELEEALAAQGPSSVDSKDNNGWTLLHHASACGEVEAADALIDRGFSANAVTRNGFSSLHFAADRGYIDVCRLLVGKISNLDLRNSDGATALFLACAGGHLSVSLFLIENGASINVKSHNNRHPFEIFGQYREISMSSEEKSKSILEMQEMALEINGEALNSSSFSFSSSSFTSFSASSTTTSSLSTSSPTLSSTAPVSSSSSSPSSSSSSSSSSSIVSSPRNDHSMSTVESSSASLPPLPPPPPLQLESLSPQKDSFPSPERGDLSEMCKRGMTDDIEKELAQNPSRLLERDFIGRTLLHFTCSNGKVETAVMLMIKGMQIDESDSSGHTSLMYAAMNNHIDTVNVLIARGCDVDCKNIEGITAFYIACVRGHFDVALMLVQNDCDINVKTKDGHSGLLVYGQLSLEHLSRRNRVRAVQILWEAANSRILTAERNEDGSSHAFPLPLPFDIIDAALSAARQVVVGLDEDDKDYDDVNLPPLPSYGNTAANKVSYAISSSSSSSSNSSSSSSSSSSNTLNYMGGGGVSVSGIGYNAFSPSPSPPPPPPVAVGSSSSSENWSHNNATATIPTSTTAISTATTASINVNMQCSDVAGIPEDFICPISGRIMVDPVVCADGFTYDRLNIEQYLAQNNNRSPKTNKFLHAPKLSSDYFLKSEIEYYKITSSSSNK